MTLTWKTENIIFDSLFEADVWADSIANEMYAKLYNGYDTQDYKIAYALAFRLAEMKEFRVCTEKVIDQEYRYKVWVIPAIMSKRQIVNTLFLINENAPKNQS